jgi:hypothetical protein
LALAAAGFGLVAAGFGLVAAGLPVAAAGLGLAAARACGGAFRYAVERGFAPVERAAGPFPAAFAPLRGWSRLALRRWGRALGNPEKTSRSPPGGGSLEAMARILPYHCRMTPPRPKLETNTAVSRSNRERQPARRRSP